MNAYLNALSLLPEEFKKPLSAVSENIACKIKEIRFRSGEPIVLYSDKIYYITKSGFVTSLCSSSLLVADEKQMYDVVFALSRRSLHTYQDMIAKGYIPLRGGCKAGVAGRAVMKNNVVYSVSAFNSVNIRVSREYDGCADELLAAVGDCTSYLIIGSPMSGKTTLLRALCRFYSGKSAIPPKKIAIIDERDEIASRTFGCFVDVGVHTDVLTLYPKAIGTEIALRTLSPEIIILDEIGTVEEAGALLSAMNSGVDFIATAHGGCFEEVLRRPNIKALINAGVFKKAIVLEGKQAPCRVKDVVSF
ncbi:MAG: hypothetical protein IIX14_08505 [Clostridia bacterium]|nr:hypothetical protein [Clostridia bacterium]